MARLGGDEFVVMLEDLGARCDRSHSRHAEAVGEKILAALNQPFRLDGLRAHSTPSIGVALFAGHQDDIDELLKRADLAMYQAKAAGRNTMRFFDPGMQAAISDRAALESDLRQGMQRNEFLLHYQPQVDGNGRVIGAEALLRWQQSAARPGGAGGLHSAGRRDRPDRAAGPCGCWKPPAGSWQRGTSSRMAAGLTLAVNVSARQFRHPEFVGPGAGSDQQAPAPIRAGSSWS